MARILCNVAGGGKPLKGNAETGDVLAGKTFSNKQSNALTGSMPNNGAWSASTSGSGSVTIPAGYHNGRGTVSGATSYSNGYSKGVSDADRRVNTSSASYKSGYANGYNTVVVETVTGAGIGWSKTYPGTVLAAGITYADQIYYSWDNGDMGIHAWCSTSGNTVSVTANGDTGSGNNKLTRASFNLVVAYRTA